MSFKSSGDKTPRVKPVTRIEVSDKNFKVRVIIAALLFGLGIGAIVFGVNAMLNTDPGWNLIEAASSEMNCSDDFVFNYNFSGSGGDATTQNRNLNMLYTEATETGFLLFSKDVASDTVHNVHYVNAHVNQEIEVDPVLYDAFALLQKYGNRCLYLAPVYVEYNRIYLTEHDSEAEVYDPMKNQEVADYVREVARYANDPAMIDIELRGDNRICLRVSDEYLRFAEENGIEEFLDFNWMTNGFIIDYMADLLIENGYTAGYLASYDGFTRNLDPSGEQYTFNIMDRYEDGIYLAAKMTYSDPTAIVFLRNYPMGDSDRWHYYSYEDGSITTPYIDPTDGMSRTAADNLVSYSGDAGCAEILLRTISLYMGQTLDTDSLAQLAAEGIHSVWCEDTTIRYTDDSLALSELYEGYGIRYTKASADQ